MTCQHTAQHNEIRAAAERFCHVARYGAAAIADDLPTQAVCSIRTLDNGGKLRVAHAGFHTCGANGARTDTDLNDICASQNQLFAHFAGHDIARADRFVRPGFARFSDKLYEVFGVTIRHVDTNEIQPIANGQNLLRFFEIGVGGAGRDHDMA